LFRSNLFPGSIFHTKSVTPGLSKLDLHARVNGKGVFVTSQDEEAALENYGYERFAMQRFSSKPIFDALSNLTVVWWLVHGKRAGPQGR